MPTSNSQMQRVRDLIREGQKKQAVALLAGLIERDHNNAELWWLLANAATDYHTARRALEEVLSLNPGDERAKKMLDRIETRQMLQQMGIKQEAAPRRAPQRRILLYALGGVAGAIILVAAVVGISRLTGSANGEMPTVVAFNTLAPTTAPTDEPTVVTEVPTEEPTQAPKTQIAPEQTGEAVAMFNETEEAPQPTEEPIVPDFSGVPNATEQVTVEVAPPTSNPQTIPPESTQEVRAPETLPVDTSNPALDVPNSPESTQEMLPPAADGGSQLALTPPTTDTGVAADSAALEPVSDIRGQVLDGQARRDIISPYGIQGWTFSAFRGEKIKLELSNVTGNGNPSLELRNEAGQVVAADIDVVSGSNIDSMIEVTVPSDGVYTVVVRMAAVEEQLYSLKLTRAQ